MKWKYKNSFFLVVSLIILYIVTRTPLAAAAISKLGEWGYFGAFVAGIFFVSIFTVAPSVVVVYYLAQELNGWEVSIFAGIGAVIGDALIFNYLRDGFFEEIKPIFKFLQKPLLVRVFNSPFFSWVIPIVGAVIIASPFPDEIGIGLMGLSRIRRWQFMVISFILNTIGLLIIVKLAKN